MIFGRTTAFLAVVTGMLGASQALAAAGSLQPIHHVGDSWTEDRQTEIGTSGYTEERDQFRIQSLGPETMVVGIKREGAPGEYQDHIVGLDLSQRKLIEGQETVTGQPYHFPLAPGKSWTVDYTNTNSIGRLISTHYHEVWTVIGPEDVTTPAGTFLCIRVEGHGSVANKLAPAATTVSSGYVGARGGATLSQSAAEAPHIQYGGVKETFYFAPELGISVRSVYELYNTDEARIRRQTMTVVAFQHGE